MALFSVGATPGGMRCRPYNYEEALRAALDAAATNAKYVYNNDTGFPLVGSYVLNEYPFWIVVWS